MLHLLWKPNNVVKMQLGAQRDAEEGALTHGGAVSSQIPAEPHDAHTRAHTHTPQQSPLVGSSSGDTRRLGF